MPRYSPTFAFSNSSKLNYPNDAKNKVLNAVHVVSYASISLKHTSATREKQNRLIKQRQKNKTISWIRLRTIPMNLPRYSLYLKKLMTLSQSRMTPRMINTNSLAKFCLQFMQNTTAFSSHATTFGPSLIVPLKFLLNVTKILMRKTKKMRTSRMLFKLNGL